MVISFSRNYIYSCFFDVYKLYPNKKHLLENIRLGVFVIIKWYTLTAVLIISILDFRFLLLINIAIDHKIMLIIYRFKCLTS